MPSRHLRIRSACDEDLDAVAALWAESARTADGAPAVSASASELRERMSAELEGGWTLSVATLDDRLVGFTAILRAEAILDQLFVDPSLQRQGVGRTLLDHAKASIPEGFTLRTAAANARARAFYEANGLVKLRETTHPLRGYAVCFYGWKVA